MGHSGLRGGELTGVDWPATGILGLGLLPDCDGFSGVVDLRCGVVGGFLTKGVSPDLGSSAIYSVL